MFICLITLPFFGICLTNIPFFTRLGNQTARIFVFSEINILQYLLSFEPSFTLLNNELN